MRAMVKRAKDLAYRAHAGQVDKAGRPYIEHVARVAARVADDHEAETVAWLHDVLEDCALEFRREVLTFPESVHLAVARLTRRREPDGYYYSRIRANKLALRVKLADIEDNSDEARLAQLDGATADRLRRKYARARVALEGHNTLNGLIAGAD